MWTILYFCSEHSKTYAWSQTHLGVSDQQQFDAQKKKKKCVMGAGNDAMATLPVLTDKYYPDNPENISRIIASIWHIPQKKKRNVCNYIG